MFGSGGALDLHSAFGNLGRAAATGFQSILPAGLGFLGPVAALAGGALGGWLSSLFQRPPKVPQGEYSVWLSDPATPQYASTRFPSVTDAAQGCPLAEIAFDLEPPFDLVSRLVSNLRAGGVLSPLSREPLDVARGRDVDVAVRREDAAAQ